MAALALTPEQDRRRSRWLIVAALGATVALLAAVAFWQQQAPGGAASRAAAAAAPTVDASLGRGMATAEFSAAFAKQLRDEQDRRAGELRAAIVRELEGVKTEMQAHNAVLKRELDEERARTASLAQQTASARELAGAEPLKIGGAGGEAGGAPMLERLESARYGDFGGASAGATVAPPGGVARAVVPPNGFVRGRLLSGMVATVGAQPTAGLVRLEGRYTTANGFVADLNGCVVALEATPNLPAGRIEGRPARLTCNFEDGRSQTWDVGGWVVDGADGIRGVRGVIVSNEEKKIALRSFGAALDAAGKVIVQGQMTFQTGPFGTIGTMTGDPTKALGGGALSGAGEALSEEIQNYYKLFAPSIQVGADTQVTVVLTHPLDLPPEGSYVSSNYVRAAR
jgi:conjugal transfer pilus assembly protein TraB